MLQGWAKAVQLSERIDAARAMKEGGEHPAVSQGRKGVAGRSMPSAQLPPVAAPLNPGKSVPRAQFPAAATLPSWLMDVSSDSEDENSAPLNPEPSLQTLPATTLQNLRPLSAPQLDPTAATNTAPKPSACFTPPSPNAPDLQGIPFAEQQPPSAPIVTAAQSGVVNSLDCGAVGGLVGGVPAMVDPTCSYPVRLHESVNLHQTDQERVAMVRPSGQLDI